MCARQRPPTRTRSANCRKSLEPMARIQPAVSAPEAGRPTTQGRFCAQTPPFQSPNGYLSEGVGAGWGPEQLIKMATGQLRHRVRDEVAPVPSMDIHCLEQGTEAARSLDGPAAASTVLQPCASADWKATCPRGEPFEPSVPASSLLPRADVCLGVEAHASVPTWQALCSRVAVDIAGSPCS